MVAILVLTTFVIFVLVDYYFQRRAPQRVEAASASPKAKELPFPMDTVGGFKLPAQLAYHPGHSWAAKEGRQVVRVGMDDFAVRLIGKIDQLELPARGRWLRQGEKGWAIKRGSHRYEILSPMEGEVVDVNMEVLQNPAVLGTDPFGAGWLVAVQAPAAEGNLKNLLHGRLAQRWMEDSVITLQGRIDGGTGARLQDGGHAVSDVLGQVPEDRWDDLVRELLLS
ncbi:MAG: glycine cleavage system protein H [Acidobacteriia bacterium]|nr:glycine cleavage system protein H [Terriglobia bacterium]